MAMQIQDTEQPIGNMTSTGGLDSVIREPNNRDGDPQTEVWRVVSVKHNGVGLLFSFPVRDNETGEEVMERLRRQFGASKVNQCLNRIFFFREQALFIGTISLSSIAALESQVHGVPVDVDVIKLALLLTQGFYDPSTMALWMDFGFTNRLFAHSALISNPFSAPLALVIGWTTTKSFMIWLILLLCLISLAAGVVVGKLCHNAGLGLAVTSGVAAILSVVEIVMLLQLKPGSES